MTEPKHTPGPWKVLGEDVVFECNEKEVVAWVGDIDGQMINNAHLLSAAPDMYEALETVCGACVYVKLAGEKCCEYCVIQKALRKARGETE